MRTHNLPRLILLPILLMYFSAGFFHGCFHEHHAEDHSRQIVLEQPEAHTTPAMPDQICTICTGMLDSDVPDFNIQLPGQTETEWNRTRPENRIRIGDLRHPPARGPPVLS